MSHLDTDKKKYRKQSARWAAIAQRDPNADGRFYYAVTTTGVVCRPSCKSRQPNSSNVRYFDTLAEALAADYRACKRCRPDLDPASHPRTREIQRACRQIESATKPLKLADLAKEAGLSAHHFQRVFKAILGVTPKQYEKACRESGLRQTIAASTTITEAIFDAGFQSSAALYRNARETLGMTPSRRKSGASGETIRFAVGECTLGSVLVGATDAGVCTITLGDDPQRLVEQFELEFHDATLVAGDDAFQTHVANVVGLVDNPARAHDIPLDIRGTAFQKMVWAALRDIKPGETCNYTEIAKKLGRPKSARAVANACGSNRLAVAIPCHRVIRSDGSLAGYRWGVDRKRQLLEREQL